MSTKPKDAELAEETAPKEVAEPGYAQWLEGEIADGLGDIKAGRVTPANKVWSELGIE